MVLSANGKSLTSSFLVAASPETRSASRRTGNYPVAVGLPLHPTRRDPQSIRRCWSRSHRVKTVKLPASSRRGHASPKVSPVVDQFNGICRRVDLTKLIWRENDLDHARNSGGITISYRLRGPSPDEYVWWVMRRSTPVGHGEFVPPLFRVKRGNSPVSIVHADRGPRPALAAEAGIDESVMQAVLDHAAEGPGGSLWLRQG